MEQGVISVQHNPNEEAESAEGKCEKSLIFVEGKGKSPLKNIPPKNGERN